MKQNPASMNTPQPVKDGKTIRMRSTRYGDQIVQPIMDGRYGAADEGSYFTARDTSIDVGVRMFANQTSFSATNGLFVFFNTAPSGGARVCFDYIRLIVRDGAGTATRMNFAIVADYIPREPTTQANRQILIPTNANADSGASAVCQPMAYTNAAAMTIPTSSGYARTVARCSIATSTPNQGDEYFIKFADKVGGTPGQTAARFLGDVARIGTSAPPVIIGPQQWAVVHMWAPNATNPKWLFEYEIGWWER